MRLDRSQSKVYASVCSYDSFRIEGCPHSDGSSFHLSKPFSIFPSRTLPRIYDVVAINNESCSRPIPPSRRRDEIRANTDFTRDEIETLVEKWDASLSLSDRINGEITLNRSSRNPCVHEQALSRDSLECRVEGEERAIPSRI